MLGSSQQPPLILYSCILEFSSYRIQAAASGEYVPFKAGKIKQTLWVSKNDHRASFYTFD